MNHAKRKIDYLDPSKVSIFDELSLWSSYFTKLILDNIEMRPNLNILDAGCGLGVPTMELAQRFGGSCQFTGIDPWEAAHKRAEWKKEVYHLDNVNLILGSANEIPFEDKHFDMVISNLGINNFDDPKTAFQECFRVLKKGGKLYLTTNLVGHYREFYDVYESVLKEAKRKDLIKKLKTQENHRGTIESIRELFDESGFAITKLVRDRFSWRYLDGTALLNHSLTVLGFLKGWQSILEEDEIEPIFNKIEEKLNEIATKNGELKMSVPMLFVEAVK